MEHHIWVGPRPIKGEMQTLGCCRHLGIGSSDVHLGSTLERQEQPETEMSWGSCDASKDKRKWQQEKNLDLAHPSSSCAISTPVTQLLIIKYNVK